MQSPHIILITGASSGIGAALARHYAAPGITLHLAGRHPARLEEIAAFCRGQGAEAFPQLIDATDEPAMRAWLEKVDAEKPIDLVIANAGISGGSGGGTIHAEEPDQVRRILSVNVGGVLNTVLPMISRMAARRSGQIAIMSSLAGMRGLPSAPAYSTSKAAVKAYGEALRGWLAKYNVQVNVIMPGYIATPLTAKNPFPMPLLMTPERAADIIARGLACNRARIVFPRTLYVIMWLACHALPTRVSDAIFARLPAKPALSGGDA